MNKEEIIEGKRVLADYMGWKEAKRKKSYWHPSNSRRYYSEEGLLFNKSWNWIIPAWAKFYKECLSFIYGKGRKELLEQFDVWDNNFKSAMDVNSPKDAFNILTKAIQWYNTTQTPKP